MATRTQAHSDLGYLCRALKAPSLARSVERLAERARAESWTHEQFLAACLEREVAARQSNGGEIRVKAARFPARKTLEEFDFDHQRSLKRDVIAHLGALDFIEARENVVFLGPPGTGKTHLAIGSPSGPARPATGCSSPPRPNGWTAWPSPIRPAASTRSSPGSVATRSS
jgi:DNA replication protein DnaC